MTESGSGVARRVVTVLLILACVAASAIFLFLDPGSLDVRLIYGGF
jgi:hypothetical protein